MKPTAADLWSDFCKIHYLDLPTAIEAERAARKLYRFAMGETFTGTISLHKGNSRSYLVSSQILRVGYQRGWPAIIRDLAWTFVQRANPDITTKIFDATRHSLELKMTKEFFKRKWWAGVLKPEIVVKPPPTKDAVRQGKIARLRQRREAWVKKQERATNAIKKIDRSINGLKRYS